MVRSRKSGVKRCAPSVGRPFAAACAEGPMRPPPRLPEARTGWPPANRGPCALAPFTTSPIAYGYCGDKRFSVPFRQTVSAVRPGPSGVLAIIAYYDRACVNLPAASAPSPDGVDGALGPHGSLTVILDCGAQVPWCLPVTSNNRSHARRHQTALTVLLPCSSRSMSPSSLEKSSIFFSLSPGRSSSIAQSAPVATPASWPSRWRRTAASSAWTRTRTCSISPGPASPACR